MAESVIGPSTKKRKKSKPLKGDEKQTVASMSEELSEKCRFGGA
jgi:hypothetical protein